MLAQQHLRADAIALATSTGLPDAIVATLTEHAIDAQLADARFVDDPDAAAPGVGQADH